mmetsp:Transcript_13885/g.15822  ORF Transcript_13885/g.15822 Transcript_13885/m.15822 type:complete len:230 (-) Transcript_13885:102-791(-)
MSRYESVNGNETEADAQDTTVADEYIVSRPRLQPDSVAGCFCPAGTMMQHSSNDLKWKLIGYMEMLLHVTYVFASGYEIIKIDQYDTDNPEKKAVQNLQRDPVFFQSKENFREDVFTQAEIVTLILVYNVWLLWNVVVRAIFFCCYEPRKVEFRGNTPEELIQLTPSFLARLFFPLATVYYHEGSTFNEKIVFTFCLRQFYSICFYWPTKYRTKAVEMAEVNISPAKQV